MSLSVDWLAEKIAEDFVANEVTADVFYGAEKTSQAKPGPRVVVGLDPAFEIGPPAGQNAPGVRTLPGGTHGARALMTRQQGVKIQIKAVPPAGSDRNPDRSKLAHQLCSDLLHATLAAIHRIAGAAGTGTAAPQAGVDLLRGEWQGVGTADFHYPAEVHLFCALNIPVLDVKWPRVAVAELTTRLYAVDPGGGSETLASETTGPVPA